MSSGVEADIALDAAVIASLGLIRVLGGTAGLAAAGAGALASFAEERAAIRAARLQDVEHHEQAVGEVLDRNARIAALKASAERHDADVALPAPLEPAGRAADELVAWCAEADIALTVAEESLGAGIAAAAAGRIFAAVSSLEAEPGEVRPAEARPAQPAPPALAATIARVLARLLPDTTDDDLKAVTEAAEAATNATTDAEAESLLTEVRIRIQEANEQARRRREDRSAATRFLRELEPSPEAAAVCARLREVADGERAFEEDLRAEALRLVAAAQKQAEHRYVTGALREAFEDLGYEVSEGFETLTAQDGEAFLTRGEWAQHAIKVRVDERQVRMALLRTEPAEGEEQRRLDVEREEQWCASFDAARERLTAAGIHADVRWRIEQGEKQLPVVQRPRTRQQPRTRSRERDR